MANSTEAIVKESLDALMDDQSFLPDLKGLDRKKAFSSLHSILSTPDHVNKSYLRVSLENGEVERIPAFRVQHIIKFWALIKAVFAFIKQFPKKKWVISLHS